MHLLTTPRLLEPDRLIRARKLRGLTQRELAEKAGLSTNTIGFYERGEVGPSPASLLQLADALDLPVLELSPLPVLPTLADIRGRLGLTAVDMGQRLGVSRMTVDRIERGRDLQIDTPRWADAYGLEVEEFEGARKRGR